MAKLAEQAERYDGKLTLFECSSLSSGTKRTILNVFFFYRNGSIHQGSCQGKKQEGIEQRENTFNSSSLFPDGY
jgi:hypothetical protein